MVKKIVVTGSLALDHIMSMPGLFRNHILPDKLHVLNVSFIMNTFRQEFGGTAGNIVWTLGLLETPSVLVACAGGDFGPYERHLSKVKSIDLSGIKIYKKLLTSRGFVTTDREDNQIWGFFEGAMKKAETISIKKFLKEGNLIVIAPNDPLAMARYVDESIGKGRQYMFDPAFNIPHFDKRFLKKAIKNSLILIGNDYEIELIKRRLSWSKQDLRANANIVITTLGSRGAIIEKKDMVIVIPAAKPVNESDPTGAGDAFRAGFLAGFVKGYSLETCGKMGAVAAVYTVEKYGTQTHKFTMHEFGKRFKDNFPNDKINP